MEDIISLPMFVNVGDPQDWKSHLGFADITKNEDDECIEIKIRIRGNTILRFEDMVEIFELKAIGFAGIKRPESE